MDIFDQSTILNCNYMNIMKHYTVYCFVNSNNYNNVKLTRDSPYSAIHNYFQSTPHSSLI